MAIKQRFRTSFGDLGIESAWDVPTLAKANFSRLIPAGETLCENLIALPPATNASVIKSPDSIGDSLAAAVGGRRAGTGKSPYGVLLSAWVYSDNAGGVYAPACTLQLRVRSAPLGGANSTITNLTAALDCTTISTIWTQLVLTVPTERQFSLDSRVITTASTLFYGDILEAVVVNAGGDLDVTGKLFSVIVEAS
jgi:hypothetical protein